MELLIFIATGIIGITLYVVSLSTQNTKRTVNKWSREITELGRISSRETSELGTLYSNSFSNWFIEIDDDNRLQVLRNSAIREKIREYRMYRKLRDILLLIFFSLAGLSFYLFAN